MRRITRLLKKLKFWQYSSASQVPKVDNSVFDNLTLSLIKYPRFLHGPFKGMKYPKLSAVGSSLCLELLGTCKRELVPHSSRVLDLVCEPKDQRAPIGHLGHHYLGVDVDWRDADLLVDSNALLFQSQSFDCIFSYAVLEHLHNPFVAMTEIARVLKPGGLFLGTVSQGEPFHASYFHHTAWGLLSLLSQVPQLSPKRLWPAIDTLDSLASMGRYPKPIRQGLAALARLHAAVPQLAPRKARWPQKEREIDAIHRAGSIAFVIEKVVA